MLFPGNESWSEVPEGNDTESGEGPGPEAVVVPVLFGVIFVLGVVGNCLVLAVVGRARYSTGSCAGSAGALRAASPTNLFILNLSVADLCFLLVCVPVHATIYSLPEWVFGAFLCTFGHYVFTVCMLPKERAPRSGADLEPGARVVGARGTAPGPHGAPHGPQQHLLLERWPGPSRSVYRVSILALDTCCRCCSSAAATQSLIVVMPSRELRHGSEFVRRVHCLRGESPKGAVIKEITTTTVTF
ncbi:hypothetical protein WMY93_000042 [Mugilogobius chulae]|uniref:G-protein coupled receptors family 1 profile domain-containing protein n=1 Tax=Mugilogobius chulae TaxID=88201 RepID=A0AAW0QD61_9GOBI